MAVFVASGVVAYLNTRTLKIDALQITHSHEVLAALDDVLSLAKDAETGQRGYLVTGDERYLERACSNSWRSISMLMPGRCSSRTGHYRRMATYGVPTAGGTLERFEPGDGLLGQAAKDGRTFYVRDVPEGY